MEDSYRLDELIGRLKAKGYRLTPQRYAVLRLLATSPEHPTAEQVYAQLAQEFPGISLGTVYKTIALLKEHGEVFEISLDDGTNHFDVRRPEPHSHLICVHCKSVMDLDVPLQTCSWDEVKNQTGYEIVSQRIDFFGICPRCQESKLATPS